MVAAIAFVSLIICSQDGLEPFIDEGTIIAHYEGHHNTYTTKTNALLRQWREIVSFHLLLVAISICLTTTYKPILVKIYLGHEQHTWVINNILGS